MEKAKRPILKLSALSQMNDAELKEIVEKMIQVWEEKEKRKAKSDKRKFEKFCEGICRRKRVA
jgi:hypothetical protein